MVLNVFKYLFGIFVLFFYQKNCVFIIFISIFRKLSNFGNRILTNQNCWFPTVSGTVCEQFIFVYFSFVMFYSAKIVFYEIPGNILQFSKLVVARRW